MTPERAAALEAIRDTVEELKGKLEAHVSAEEVARDHAGDGQQNRDKRDRMEAVAQYLDSAIYSLEEAREFLLEAQGVPGSLE